MNPARMPLWFRATVIALFVGVFGVYFFVRDALFGNAMARSLIDRVVNEQRPALNLQAILAKQRQEPEGGAYRINGVRVAFRNLPAPMGAREALTGFQRMFQRAGYTYRLVQIRGELTLVAVHPKSGMMILVRPGRDRAGRPTMRISEHNLADADSHYTPEIPGVPMLPDAHHQMLVQSLEGPPSESMMYAVGVTPEWASEFYARELGGSGWIRLTPPVTAPASLLTALFFQKGDRECSVLAMPSPETRETLVLVTMTGKAREDS